MDASHGAGGQVQGVKSPHGSLEAYWNVRAARLE